VRRSLAVAFVALALAGAAGAAASAPASACRPRTYEVRAGDTLFSIAQRFGTTVRAIARANRLDPKAILQIGAHLRVPVSCADARASAAAAEGAPAAELTPSAFVRALRSRTLPLARTSAVVVDLASGETVLSLNGTTPREPASTEKLPVELAALETLGPSFRTRTEVLAQGTIEGGVLRGALVLKGYGDPLLGDRALAALARAVRRHGIVAVTRGIVGDESFFDAARTARGWKPSFYKVESPPLSALVANRAVLDGQVVGRPALAAALVFRQALVRAGVSVAGPASIGVAGPGAVLVGRRVSPPLSVLLSLMGTWSDNFVAETVLKQLGAQVGGEGSSHAGTIVVRSVLAREGVSLAGTAFFDGSGLSQLDRMTATTLAGVLAAAWRNEAVAAPLLRSLSIVGETGTLRNRLRGVAGHADVHAKSGTTDACSALAGYVGSRYAFAVLSNGAPVDVTAAHEAQDRLLRLLLHAASVPPA
jgi:serine-type D-Ala-D-Ala carboxypeptidase/endopeptidase (penicillin-binding protein 4)